MLAAVLTVLATYADVTILGKVLLEVSDLVSLSLLNTKYGGLLVVNHID